MAAATAAKRLKGMMNGQRGRGAYTICGAQGAVPGAGGPSVICFDTPQPSVNVC